VEVDPARKPTVFVTGAGGLLGGQVAWTFAERGVNVIAATHAHLDITDPDKVRTSIIQADPGVVINGAGMTDVDACESDPDRAFAINALGAENLAVAARETGAAIVHVSSDYVFDGAKGSYVEDDQTNPIQVYGRSKLEGEERVRAATPWHFIVRSAWIYGAGGKNFISKHLPRLLASGEPINAVDDQCGSPTYAPDLAEALTKLVETLDYGTYHVVNEGTCSFADVAEAALEIVGASNELKRVPVASFARPAPRPHDTSLVAARWRDAGFEPLRHWRQAVESFLRDGLRTDGEQP
jgi:dTDP-4-dehydrorhamnose reductase